MKNSLKDILKGKIVILGIGNMLRGDDGFGPALVGALEGNPNLVTAYALLALAHCRK